MARKNKVIERKALNTKEFNFATMVLSGKPPREAALECGYSSTSLQTTVWRLMQTPRIAAYIDAEKKRIEDLRRQVNQVDDEWITRKFKEILDRCMQAQPVMRFDKEAGEMRQSRDEDTGELLFVFDSAGAIKAAENLAKHIGYYEIDNRQKQTVIKIGAVQNVANFFFEDEQQQQEGSTLEAGE